MGSPSRSTTGSRTRTSTDSSGDYAWSGEGDARFSERPGSARSIVTSAGREDAGVFQFSLGDPRYLPFEGEGVISNWKLELTSPFPSFDPRSISDVVMTMRYTAREGGEALAQGAIADLQSALDLVTTAELGDEATPNSGAGQALGLSVRRDLPDAWHAFLNEATVDAGTTTHSLSLALSEERFPQAHRAAGIAAVTGATLLLVVEGGASSKPNLSTALFEGSDLTNASTPAFSQWLTGTDEVLTIALPVAGSATTFQTDGTLALTFTETDWNDLPTVTEGSESYLDSEKIKDLLVILHYDLTSS